MHAVVLDGGSRLHDGDIRMKSTGEMLQSKVECLTIMVYIS